MTATSSAPAPASHGKVIAGAGTAHMLQSSALWRTGPHPSLSSDQPPACAGRNPELFFPPDGAPGRWNGWEAKQICGTCPFVDDCREWAVSGGPYLFGVWGGTTHAEREAIRDRRRREDADG